MKTSQALLVLSNVPDLATGRTIAKLLVERRLAACINLLPQVHSIFRWQDVIEEAQEVTLMIKTSNERYAEVEAAIQAAHPYQVPEVIALPIAQGLPAYLDWMDQETKRN